MINFKNVIENIIYILLIAAVLILNTYFVLRQQEKTIIKAIEKSTTEINNKIKVKNKKGTLDLTNTLETDSIPTKKHWWQRR